MVIAVLRTLPPLRFLAGMGLFTAALYLADVAVFWRGNQDPAFWGLWAWTLCSSSRPCQGLRYGSPGERTIRKS
jgi:hypothetical protein